MRPAAKPRTIIVVDDQPDFLEFARTRLARDGTLAVIGEATSGAAALELVHRMASNLDGVLLDVEMPGMDGLETARRLRAVAPAVRIILTSASDAPGYATAAARIGAMFLSKRDLSAEAVLDLLD